MNGFMKNFLSGGNAKPESENTSSNFSIRDLNSKNDYPNSKMHRNEVMSQNPLNFSTEVDREIEKELKKDNESYYKNGRSKKSSEIISNYSSVDLSNISYDKHSIPNSRLEIEAKLANPKANLPNPEYSIEFVKVAEVLSKVEVSKGESSKEKKEELLSELIFLIMTDYPDDLVHLFYFVLSKTGPEYRSPELGVGKEHLLKCVAKATGKSDKHIKEQMQEVGDLSVIAMNGKSTMNTLEKFGEYRLKKNKRPLTLIAVMNGIYKVAEIKGKECMEEKEKVMLKLMFDSVAIEIKYVVRSLEKSLKIGASFKTVMIALSKAVVKYYYKFQKKNLEYREINRIIQKCIYQLSDYDLVFKNLMTVVRGGEDFSTLLDLCKIMPGIPVKPMLAKPTTGVNMVAYRFKDVSFSCEYKYDGFRGQIHYLKDKNKHENYKHPDIAKLNLFNRTQIQIFSRNLENMTEIYPDIVHYFSTFLSNSSSTFSCILDCEIVPFDKNSNKILPFQALTTRSRKNVNKDEISVHVCCFLFDILLLNDVCLMDKTLEERRTIIKENFVENDNVKITKYINSEEPEEIMEFMDESIKAGCEGLIVKALSTNSNYQPGERNFNWLKLKKDYLTDCTIGDSLDLVPIGAVFGKGKRTGTYGSFLLACYDADSECYETVSMTGAGLKDDDLKNFYNVLSQCVLEKPLESYKVGDISLDIVWFEPKYVWEIKTADLSMSPKYTAASSLLNKDGKGISLRFPRFIRTRDDKKPTEATGSEDIYKMFNEQAMNEKNIKKYTQLDDGSDDEN